jgi:hypothetical protein
MAPEAVAPSRLSTVVLRQNIWQHVWRFTLQINRLQLNNRLACYP